MKRVYHLSSCSTCKKILDQLNLEGVELIDIKVNNIDESTLDWIKEKEGSYEALFSKRAMKYKSMGLKEKNLKDEDFKQYMLEEYTFLKRPFIINGEEMFIGNSKKVVEAAIESFNS